MKFWLFKIFKNILKFWNLSSKSKNILKNLKFCSQNKTYCKNILKFCQQKIKNILKSFAFQKIQNIFEKFCSKCKPKQNFKIFLKFWNFQNIFSKYFEILRFLGFQNYFEILIFCFSRKFKIILKFCNFQNFSKIIFKFWPKQNFGKIILKFCYFKISKYFWNFQFHTALAPWSTIGSSKQPWITYGEHLFFKP